MGAGPLCCACACTLPIVFALGATAFGRPGPARISLVFTADSRAQIATCGCSGGQYGGLVRRGTAVRNLASDGAPLIAIDGGGVLGADARVIPYFAEAYGAMGYDLVLPSGADLTLKTEDGRTLAEELTKNGVGVLALPAGMREESGVGEGNRPARSEVQYGRDTGRASV